MWSLRNVYKTIKCATFFTKDRAEILKLAVDSLEFSDWLEVGMREIWGTVTTKYYYFSWKIIINIITFNSYANGLKIGKKNKISLKLILKYSKYVVAAPNFNIRSKERDHIVDMMLFDTIQYQKPNVLQKIIIVKKYI